MMISEYDVIRARYFALKDQYSMRPFVKFIIIGIMALNMHIVNIATANIKSEIDCISKEIKTILPDGWYVEEIRSDAIPRGHYDGLNHEGNKGKYLLIVGRQNINYDWKDKNGIWHAEPILKEAIQLWVMPPSYRRSWKRFFIMKRKESAEQIYSGNKVKVFGSMAVYWPPSSQNRYEQILSSAIEIGQSPDPSDQAFLSWKSWEIDIRKLLKRKMRLRDCE